MSDRPIRDNSGALFRNEKADNPNRPDYRGDITINGQKFWLSAWIKDGQKGKFMSLSAQPADAPKAESKPAGRGGAPALDDDIPFSMEWR